MKKLKGKITKLCMFILSHPECIKLFFDLLEIIHLLTN